MDKAIDGLVANGRLVRIVCLLLRWGPATGLALLCLGLVLILHDQWRAVPDQENPEIQSDRLTQELPEPKGKQLTPLPSRSTLSAIVERPLFRKDRRPFEPEEQPEGSVSKQATAPPSLQLRGVALTEGGRPIALIKSEKRDGLARVKQGEAIGNWQIATILSRAILVRQGERTYRIPLARPGEQAQALELRN